MNREDGGDRRFIMVQLPEETNNPDYPTIADIGRERVRRVIHTLNAEDEGRLPDADKTPRQDRGFRSFKLTASNFKVWDEDVSGSPEEFAARMAAQLEAFAENVVEGRTEEDILYEVLLKAGLDLPLTAKVAAIDLAGRTAYSVADGLLVVYLADEIDAAVVKAVAEETEPQPGRFICLDAAFAGDDQLKTNTALRMRDAGIEFRTL